MENSRSSQCTDINQESQATNVDIDNSPNDVLLDITTRENWPLLNTPEVTELQGDTTDNDRNYFDDIWDEVINPTADNTYQPGTSQGETQTQPAKVEVRQKPEHRHGPRIQPERGRSRH